MLRDHACSPISLSARLILRAHCVAHDLSRSPHVHQSTHKETTVKSRRSHILAIASFDERLMVNACLIIRSCLLKAPQNLQTSRSRLRLSLHAGPKYFTEGGVL
ncbi:3f1902da-a595-4562-8fcf-5fc7e704d1e0 [Sclerotinia trifoliorum]|uniref:3f1902da-a595-4562-8fcf-5fc7e704d1e0 n=1 Tax=Sclerotinia trifoliorum TaxID=28548 RepID=A0A8H2W2T3_9HELO|nr:3f1902da-a595-4562-8fcf-5fc7e704d1e0 [Sclerotinia trifoliorum]